MNKSYTIISDTHGLLEVNDLLKNCESDVLIHCGDFTTAAGRRVRNRVSHEHYLSMVNFSQELLQVRHQFKHVICVPGNHDKIAEIEPRVAKDILWRKTSAHLLIDESVILDGVKYYGMPWTPPFNNWFFNARREVMKLACDKIEYDTQVLITHGPPHGVLDQVDTLYDALGEVAERSEHFGSHILKKKLPKLLKLDLHAFGHIHSPGGTVDMGRRPGTQELYMSANCAMLSEDYEPHSAPVRITIDH